MPLTDEQAEQMYQWVREIHAAMLARRAQRPTVGEAVDATRPRVRHDAADPIVKLLPRNWSGPDLRGKHFSECPPNFLGMTAHLLDSFADKNADDPDPQKQKFAKWDRENAEAARRWRAKLEGKPDLFGESVEKLADEGAF